MEYVLKIVSLEEIILGHTFSFPENAMFSTTLTMLLVLPEYELKFAPHACTHAAAAFLCVYHHRVITAVMK